MAKYICEQCRGDFTRDKSGDRPIRFCSEKCYHEWRSTGGKSVNHFKSGMRAWNHGKKGIHLSPGSEFKPGLEPVNKLPIGSATVRRDKNGKDRAWIKVGEPNIWKLRDVVEWEKAYGTLPEGLLVHHADRDTLNDSTTNLCAMSRAAHMKTHRNEIEPNRLDGLRRAASRKRNSRRPAPVL